MLGRLFGMGMGRINRGVNSWVISLLDVQPDARVLEIGFGPGRAIQQVEQMLTGGRAYGVDVSTTMVEQASRLNRAAIQRGTVDLRSGEASDLPFPEASFDRVFCVNVIYFWATPQRELAEMFRVTRPGGRVAVYVGDREQMSGVPMTRTGLFQLFSLSDLAGLLAAAGFVNCKIYESSIAQGPISKGGCVVATRPSAL
jgi:ubiquinone/menaquinone biosynthesis C-methylase UbiE